MINYRLHLIRHGVTTANEAGQYAGGATDCELSPAGIRGLIDLREQYDYPKAELIYTAPLTRCVQTVNVVYPERGIILVDALKERNLGEFEGHTMDELRGRADYQAWLADSTSAVAEGESMRDYSLRVLEGAASVVNDMLKNEVRDAALVTDGGVIMMILSAIGMPRRTMDRWICGPGRGYTCFVTPELWTRDRVIEVVGIMPHGAQSAI